MSNDSLVSIPSFGEFSIQANHNLVSVIIKNKDKTSNIIKVEGIINHDTKVIKGGFELFDEESGPYISLIFDNQVCFSPIEILAMLIYKYKEFFEQQAEGKIITKALKELFREMSVRDGVMHIITCEHDSVTFVEEGEDT